MKNLNKKAVSGVIVTVLLVLLVFAAIAIVWAVVQPFIEGSLENVEGQAACLELRLEIDVFCLDNMDSGNCDRSEYHFAYVKVTRTQSDVELSEIRILADSEVKTTSNSDEVPASVGEAITYEFTKTGSDGLDVLAVGQEVIVVPVLADGTECNPIGPVTVTTA